MRLHPFEIDSQPVRVPSVHVPFYAGRDWRQERAGSLRSLNQLAAAVGLRLWEDFIAERVSESTWLHVELDHAGQLHATYPPASPVSPCRLCALMRLSEDASS